MKTNLEIINEAKKAYERCFKDIHELAHGENQDIILDKDFLMNEIEEMKVELTNRIDSLDFLREKLTAEAKEALENTFGKEEIKETVQSKTVDEEYEELEEEKENLMNWGKNLKSQKH